MVNGAQPPEAPAAVTKEMSLTLAEFHRSMRHFRPGVEIAPNQTDFEVQHASGHMMIVIGEEYHVRLSPLIQMPRRKVTLSFTGLNHSEAAALVTQFDKAFQRGGG